MEATLSWCCPFYFNVLSPIRIEENRARTGLGAATGKKTKFRYNDCQRQNKYAAASLQLPPRKTLHYAYQYNLFLVTSILYFKNLLIVECHELSTHAMTYIPLHTLIMDCSSLGRKTWPRSRTNLTEFSLRFQRSKHDVNWPDCSVVRWYVVFRVILSVGCPRDWYLFHARQYDDALATKALPSSGPRCCAITLNTRNFQIV